MNVDADKYRILVEQSPDGIAIYDQQGWILEINDRALELLGYTREDAWPPNVGQIVAPEDLARQPLRTDALMAGRPLIDERLLVCKDGSRLSVELSAKGLNDGTILVVVRDITERKRLENEIRRSRDLYLTLLEDFPVLVWRAGTDAKCDYFNRTWLNFTGRTLEEELGDGWLDGVHPDDLDRCLQTYKVAFDACRQFAMDYRLRRYDGVYRWIRDHGTPFYALDGTFAGYVGSCFDIEDQKKSETEIRSLNVLLEERVAERTTALENRNLELHNEVLERKRIEEALRVSQSQLQRLVEANIIGVRITNFVDGTVTYTNDAFLKMIGYTRDEFSEGKINSRNLTPSEYADLDNSVVKQLQETGVCDTYEKAYIHKDGSLVPVLVGAALLDGSSNLAISYTLDISAQKEGERERERLLASEQAARRDAEEAVHTRDELLAIVSHDLKNPLTAIKGYSQLLRRRVNMLAPDIAPKLENVIERVDQSSDKMNQMVNDLLDFGRLQAGQPLSLHKRPLNLVDLARKVAKEYERTTHMHHIVVTSETEALVGRWDSTRLEQVLSNLLSNSVKYSPDGGTITIRLWRETGDPPVADGASEANSNQTDWALLAVEDEGMGIPQSELPHIFEWYRRSKNTAGSISGAGIGLASTKYIISQHGGNVSVASEPGVGTTFTVRLPL